MELLIEIFGEIFGEIFSEILGDSALGLSRKKYIPKWLRIFMISLVMGIIMLIALAVCSGNKAAVIVFGGLIGLVWLYLIIKALRIKMEKYERVTLEDGRSFVGRRTVIFDFIIGRLDLSNLGSVVKAGEDVRIWFSKDDSIPKKERYLTIKEKEQEFLNRLIHIGTAEFAYIVNQARGKLMEKLKDKAGANNGTGLKLTGVQFTEKDTGFIVSYRFKDELSGKRVWVNEEKDLHAYDKINQQN